jgi:CDP-diacylglycerol--glycerol-3-phosphate 3-phosphatidyltransferase
MGIEENSHKPSKTFSDTLRVRFKHILDPIGAFLNRLGVTPNMLTIIGLLGNLAGAILVAYGFLTVGGLVLLVMGSLDALDGTMARLRGETTSWGAFVDSVSDRYSELFVFAGLMIHFMNLGNSVMAVIVFFAAVGSVMVSYTRARAQSLGFDAKNGILSRAERYFILVPTIIIGLPQVGVVLIAVFANVTAVQRILYVRKETHLK